LDADNVLSVCLFNTIVRERINTVREDRASERGRCAVGRRSADEGIDDFHIHPMEPRTWRLGGRMTL